MNTMAFYKTEISNILVGFDLKQVAEVYSVIKNKNSQNKKERKSLAGIWKDINSDELEQDLQELREEIHTNIDKKSSRKLWNG